jgi:short-subunit dehydrogenase
MTSVLIVGATSGIASAAAERFAAGGYSLALAGRDMAAVQRMAGSIALRYGVRTAAYRFEALDAGSREPMWRQVADDFGDLGGIVVCHGDLGDPERARTDFSEICRLYEVNLLSAIHLLNLAAAHFEQRGEGFLCAIASVAGDRGKAGNYAYGAAKAALAVYMQGLRSRLHRRGVAVITVKPGFVDTRMTRGRKGTFLVAKPATVAKGIYRAIVKRRNTVYLPRFWRPLMWGIRSIPESIYKRLSI